MSAPRIPDHELLRKIGRGSYGEVWLARNIMGTFRAVKVVYRQQFDQDRPFDRELHGIETFEPISRSHEGFVDILQIGRNDEEGYFYSVMELADPKDGTSPINPDTYEPKTIAATVAGRKALSYEECLAFGLATSSALAYLHKRGLVHRDIKPSNLIIVNGAPKLADIGMVTQACAASIPGGSLGYVAPEGIPSKQ
ncbi:MAG: protein kinase, partial [Verrucomicrobia bacterium]|nr:protein kinase [Verrucomicrobiota bacterium]